MKQIRMLLSNAGQKLREQAGLSLERDDTAEMHCLNIYDVERQKVFGFGGAFTEASSHNYMLLSPKRRAEVIDALFDDETGLGFRVCRTHIGSCDFCIGEYAYTEPEDRDLSTFSLAHDEQEILPFIKAAQKKTKNALRFFASPWSPPCWMKTNGKATGGGQLREDWKDVWAGYIARYITEYAKRGVPISAMTVQNEPFATQTWESCRYTGAEEAELAVKHLYPALKRAGLGDVKLMIWDHNRERVFERACASFASAEARELIWGIAFHWYTGCHYEGLDLCRERFPDKPLIETEFCTHRIGDPRTDFTSALEYAFDIGANLNHGASACVDWNMALDTASGPFHDRGGSLLAPIFVDAENDSFYLTGVYYGMAHFSHFIKPGAIALVSSSYDPDLQITAARNPDGGIAAVLVNRSNAKRPFALRIHGESAVSSIPAKSIATLLIG